MAEPAPVDNRRVYEVLPGDLFPIFLLTIKRQDKTKMVNLKSALERR